MARGNRMRVVVVVPAFSKGQDGDQEIIGREIFGGEAARSPHVGDRVDGPGGMQSYDYAYEDSPEQERQASDGEQDYAQNDVRAVVILRQPDVDLIFREVGDVARKSSRVVMHGAAGQ